MKYAYLDSSVWIIRTEGIPPYRNLVNNGLSNLMNDGWKLCLSDLTALEVLIKPTRQKQDDLISIYRNAFEEALFIPTFDSVFQNALFYSQQDSLKALDATHVAFAVHYGCKLFVTTDPDFLTLQSLPLHLIDLSSVA